MDARYSLEEAQVIKDRLIDRLATSRAELSAKFDRRPFLSFAAETGDVEAGVAIAEQRKTPDGWQPT